MKKIIFISMLALSLGLVTSCNIFGDKKTATKVVADPCPEKSGQIISLQAEVIRLQEQIGDLKAENAKLTADLQCCESKLPAAKKTTYTAKKTTTQTTQKVTTPVVTKSATASTPASKIMATGTPGSANLNGLRENGIISFCVMVNGDKGLHFPQKALDKGVTFTSIETNPSNDGHNWIVEPVEWMDGDYCLVIDGVFGVKNEMLARVLQSDGIQVNSVKIKAPFTRWQPIDMYLEDGYWKYNAFKH